MEKEIINNSDLHFEHVQWNRELLFMEDEIKSLQNRLSEIVSRWADKSILAHVEHFQNQFILHNEVIDIMKHDIHVHEDDISEHYKKKEDAIDRIHFQKHFEFRGRIEKQREIYNALKKEFFAFLTKKL